MTTKRPVGRPVGFSPGPKRVVTHQVGNWSWNTVNLHKRIVKTGLDDCWAWIGSSNQYGNIFGGFKFDKPQMTQANRLLYMEIHNEPIDHLSIRMTCNNKHCCNPQHFSTAKNKRFK